MATSSQRHGVEFSEVASSMNWPHAMPSEMADDTSVFGGIVDTNEDDPIIGALPKKANGIWRENISKVIDQTGETLSLRFEEFLENFTTSEGEKFYIEQIHGMRLYNLSTLYVNFAHISAYEHGVLANAIASEYCRFQPFMCKALHNLLAKYEPQYYRQHREAASSVLESGTRLMRMESQTNGSVGIPVTRDHSDRIFTIGFYNVALITRLRQVRAAQIGSLLTISGVVTRTSEVRPELSRATFTCEACGTVVPDIEQSFHYTEPTLCPNSTCGNRYSWRLDVQRSTFVDWQKVRIQENSAEIPTGSMPRCMDVILRGEMVERVNAGQKCIFTGCLIVVPDLRQFRIPGVKAQATRDSTGGRDNGGDAAAAAGGSGVTGLKALGVRDLTYKLTFLACMVQSDVEKGNKISVLESGPRAVFSLLSNDELTGEAAQREYLATLTAAEIDDLRSMVHSPDTIQGLVESLAPMVYGHSVVKKGLLLQLMGGVSKRTPEGMALRGDINVCIIGDASTSKSQFLKYICKFLPRSVYTSGKASSAAGLTAAVVKDEETGEFTIEAGALMLADRGVCAIDEFDKMDVSDQVAIHEAMEQQSISIAKAGIHVTLNARTSILAAANPAGGRYNRRATLRANINMSAAIMSRFDLFFVVLDECDKGMDERIADHIVRVHQYGDDAVRPPFTTEQLQRYVKFARTFRPKFTPEAREALVARYGELRRADAVGGVGSMSYRVTVRQLESLIRLSEALAKANCVMEVRAEFVREAYNLLAQSIISVEKDDIEVESDGDEGAGTMMDEVDEGIGINDDGIRAEGENDRVKQNREVETGNSGVINGEETTKTKVSYAKYRAMMNAFVGRLQADENAESVGVSSDELIVWYLEQVSTNEELQAIVQLDSEDAVLREEKLAKKVIARLVRENIIMKVKGEGLVEQGGEESEEAKDKIVYVLHPNCSIDDVM